MDEIGQRWAGETSAREHRALTISLTSSEHLVKTVCAPMTANPTGYVRVVTAAGLAHELPTRPEIQSEAASRISSENRL